MPPSAVDVTRDKVGFQRAVRTAIFAFLQDVLARDWESASQRMDPPEVKPAEGSPSAGSDEQRIESAFDAYFEARARFRLDPEGRSAKHTHFDENPDNWTVAQVLIDSEEFNDWEAIFIVSLPESRAANRVVIRFDAVLPVGSA